MPKESTRPVRACRNKPLQQLKIVSRDLSRDIPDKFRWDLYQESPSGRFVLKNKGHGQETTVDCDYLRTALAAAADRRALARHAYDVSRDTVAMNGAAIRSGLVCKPGDTVAIGSQTIPHAPPPVQLLTNMVPSRNYYDRTPIISPTRHQEIVALQDAVATMLNPVLSAFRTQSTSPSPARAIDPTPPRSRSTSRNPQ